MINYIVNIEGDYYEGTQVKLRLMTPQPIILGFRIQNEQPNLREWIFVEDYFNSSTRVRRGRLYRRSDYKNWRLERVTPLPATFIAISSIANVTQSYSSDGQLELGSNVVAVLGDGANETHWLVVMAERTISYELVVTLKSKTFLGVLPDVNSAAIPEGNRQDILQALEAVVESASIQAPQPVVDACRNAASHMITTRFPESNSDGKSDLGKLSLWLNNNGRRANGATAETINSLHSRGKANAAAQHGTRPLSPEDANLAVSAIAFLLQDFGWAKSREY
jgi:hypothetical protein